MLWELAATEARLGSAGRLQDGAHALATHDAHASCRSMGQTMSMGQAAGVAAAMSLEKNAGALELDHTALGDRLRGIGAVLETPKHIAATAADAWRDNAKRGVMA